MIADAVVCLKSGDERAGLEDRVCLDFRAMTRGYAPVLAFAYRVSGEETGPG